MSFHLILVVQYTEYGGKYRLKFPDKTWTVYINKCTTSYTERSTFLQWIKNNV